MLYLFNSAYRPLYTVNVLNTLTLPHGYVNEYRYKYSDKSKYLSTALFSSLDSLVSSNTDTVITFVDRFSDGGYTYHPLRKGRLVSWKQEGDQVFLRVSLADYVCSKNSEEVSKRFVEALGNKQLPVLTNADPMEPHDGHYAIENADILQGEVVEIGDDSWGKTIDAISSARMFVATKEQAPLFTRLRLKEASSKDDMKLSTKGAISTYKFKKGGKYRAIVTYRFPAQIADKTSRGEIQILTGENLAPSSTTIAIDSHANSVEVEFHSAPNAEEADGSIRIEPSITEGQAALLASNVGLHYSLVKGGGFWAQLLLLALFYALATSVQATDLSVIRSLCSSQIAWLIIPKFVLGVFQIAAIYWAVRLVGTKIM
jgi:hypothetical protein